LSSKPGGLSAARTLEELRRIAFADPRKAIAGGNLLPLEQFSDELASAIASVKIIKRNLTSGDGQVDEIHEVKFWDKVRAIEQLAKHFCLLVERIEHTGSVDLVHRLQAARRRGKPVPAVLIEATPVEE
jgi:phage terminase small subunit